MTGGVWALRLYDCFSQIFAEIGLPETLEYVTIKPNSVCFGIDDFIGRYIFGSICILGFEHA